MNDQSAKMKNHSQKMIPQPPPAPPMLMNPVQQPIMNSMVPPNQHPLGISPNQPPLFMAQRGFQLWPSQQQLQNPNSNTKKKFNSKTTTSNWKGNKMQLPFPVHGNNNTNPSVSAMPTVGTGYHPPSLNDLQNQNKMKARKFFYPKKKFNDTNSINNNNNTSRNYRNNRFAPYAPRNTSSFIIRAKKAGGIAELVSPCPVTPAVLPTPIFSPSREVLGDMAKEEWGVDGYGSMKGLIRLRSPPEGGDGVEDDDDEGNGSSDSDVEEHVEVERRLDHDLSRFEMIYPVGEYNYSGYSNVLENRVDDQDSHIAHLEEENLTLKERLFLMERELGDLRRRLQSLERQQLSTGRQDINEEVVENISENESDGGSDIRGISIGFENDTEYSTGFDNKKRNDQYLEDAEQEDTDTTNPKLGNDKKALDEQAVFPGGDGDDDAGGCSWNDESKVAKVDEDCD